MPDDSIVHLDTIPELSAETMALSARLDSLEDEFAKLAGEYQTLQSTVIPNLNSKYQLNIGVVEYGIFLVKVEIRRIKRKISLMQFHFNRGERPALSQIEKTLDLEFAEWRKKLESKLEEIRKAEDLKNSDKLSMEDTKELYSIYRSLIKRLHPDLNPNQTESDRNIWLRILTAHKCGDIDEMRILATLVKAQIKIDTPKSSLLKERCSKTEKLIFSLLEKIADLKARHPLSLRDNIEDERWISETKTGLVKELEHAEAEKRRCLDMLDSYGKEEQ